MAGGAWLVVLAACGWGTWSLFLRPTGVPPLLAATLVFLITAVAAAPFFHRDGEAKWSRRVFAMLALYAALDAVNVGAYFAAMSTTSVAVACLTHCFAPVLVALAAPFVDGHVVPRAGRSALAALVGLVLLLRPWEGAEGSVVLGAALGSASAVAYAGNIFLARRLTTEIGPTRTMGLHAIGSGLLLLPFALPDLPQLEWRDATVILGAGAVLGLGANVIFAVGLVKIGSARAAVIAFLEPLVACIVGWLAWNESMGMLGLLGGAMILGAGVTVATSGDARKTPVAAAPALDPTRGRIATLG